MSAQASPNMATPHPKTKPYLQVTVEHAMAVAMMQAVNQLPEVVPRRVFR